MHNSTQADFCRSLPYSQLAAGLSYVLGGTVMRGNMRQSLCAAFGADASVKAQAYITVSVARSEALAILDKHMTLDMILQRTGTCHCA